MCDRQNLPPGDSRPDAPKLAALPRGCPPERVGVTSVSRSFVFDALQKRTAVNATFCMTTASMHYSYSDVACDNNTIKTIGVFISRGRS